MAGSRVEKLGTIFSRTTGLIRAGAIKWSERPVWYDVYAIHPPRVEPNFSREEPPQTPIREIFYEEDIVRAKFSKEVDKSNHPGKFMDSYNRLLEEGNSKEEAFAKAAQHYIEVRKLNKKQYQSRKLDGEKKMPENENKDEKLS